MSASRVAAVTGGASGIGLAVCRRLAAGGARVAVLDRDGDAARRAADEIRAAGCDALDAAVDVTDRAAIDAALDRVRDQLGPVTIMVTSAAIDGFTPFAEMKFEEWIRVMDVNVNGTFHSLQPVIPDMIEAGWGRIVTISSSSAQSGAPGMSHYAASKGAVIALTKTLALELAPYGITVNTIPPRAIDTPMLRNSAVVKAQGDAALEQMAARMPVGRMGTPDDIAAACAFLCSEDASYITGQVIGVNGGGYI
jgi:2-hydroxycyclohexanecarboxyl-CoA dehydrogenase